MRPASASTPRIPHQVAHVAGEPGQVGDHQPIAAPHEVEQLVAAGTLLEADQPGEAPIGELDDLAGIEALAFGILPDGLSLIGDRTLSGPADRV